MHGGVAARALINYVIILKDLRGRLLDVNVLEGCGGMCDHYLVEGRIRVTGDLSEGKEGISRRG